MKQLNPECVLLKEEAVINSPKDICDILSMRRARIEYKVLLCLDSNNRLLDSALIGTGTRYEVTYDANEIIEKARQCNAERIIVIHNHPFEYATPKPSEKDFTARRDLDEFCKLMGLLLLDDMIFSRYDDYYSHYQNESRTDKYP